MAAAFPTTDPDIKGRAEARLQTLATLLPAERFQAAPNQGHEVALTTVATALLAEFAELNTIHNQMARCEQET